jgi:hypothetical protein
VNLLTNDPAFFLETSYGIINAMLAQSCLSCDQLDPTPCSVPTLRIGVRQQAHPDLKLSACEFIQPTSDLVRQTLEHQRVAHVFRCHKKFQSCQTQKRPGF